MTPVLEKLISLLMLERLEENLFRGESQDLGWGTVFGGQVLGQALSAATQTVPPEVVVHSLHGYFLRAGDVSRPIIYDVDRIRDGKSFTTRRVVAIQRGRAILNMSVSFQKVESGFEHQADMPDAPEPESLVSERKLIEEVLDQIPLDRQKWLVTDSPFEVRRAELVDWIKPKKRPPHRMVWYRIADGLPNDPQLHRYLLAYVADFNMIGTALQAHGVTWMSRGMQVASLDHAMWFHRPFRLDDWVLHVMESPNATAARALIQGRFYTRDGALIATTTQEALIRRWE